MFLKKIQLLPEWINEFVWEKKGFYLTMPFRGRGRFCQVCGIELEIYRGLHD